MGSYRLKQLQKQAFLRVPMGSYGFLLFACANETIAKASILVGSYGFLLLACANETFAIIVGSWMPIFLLLLPKCFATLNTVWGATQHFGLQEDVKDHRLSTRSVRLNPIISFIYWSMEYHIEHHMFPSVPSYNLPKLHDAIKDQLPKPQGLFKAYQEIIPAVIQKSKDPKYYIPVKLPDAKTLS